MYGVYILRSKKDAGLYTGYSDRVQARLIEHQKGKVASTKDRRPLELVYCELFKNRKDVMQREKFFKTDWGRKYIRKILNNTLKEDK